MALGAYVAFRNLIGDAGAGAEPRFGIVGFNNTDEMQNAMLMDRSGTLVGTIDQNLSTYAAKLFEIIDSLLAGEQVDMIHLIAPVPVQTVTR